MEKYHVMSLLQYGNIHIPFIVLLSAVVRRLVNIQFKLAAYTYHLRVVKEDSKKGVEKAFLLIVINI